MIEYARRILRFLGYEDLEIDESVVYLKAGCLKGTDIPIYPSVLKTLKMQNFENSYFINRYIEPEFLGDFKAYCSKYMEYCFNCD